MSRLAELGREGRAAALRGLDQRRPRGFLAVRERGRTPSPGGVLAGRGADRRHELRLEHPPRPAGDRCRQRARAQGRAGGALDAQERQHRALARPYRVPRGRPDPAPGGRGLARRAGRGDLDRIAGRAAVGAAPDGAQRPPRDQAPPRRHRRLLGHPDPRQRARGEGDDRPSVPHRLRGDHAARGADPRLRARLHRGAEADAESAEAPLRDARPRRPQAACTCTPSSPSRSGSTPTACSRARTGCRSRSTSAARASASPSSRG